MRWAFLAGVVYGAILGGGALSALLLYLRRSGAGDDSSQ